MSAPPPVVRLRALVPGDWQAFRALRLAAIADTPLAVWPTHDEEAGRSAAEIQARIAHTPTQVVFGAFADEVLVGVAGMLRNPLVQVGHKAQLWGVFVQAGWRRHGLGGALLDAAFADARAAGVLQVHLSVHAANERALGLYRARGFVEYGREPRALRVGAVFHDEVLMVLHLDGVPAAIDPVSALE